MGHRSTVESRAWYNPNLETRWNLLPGLIASLSMIQTLMLAALSVARERENGTFDQLLVTPFTPTEIMIGKAIPTILIGLIQSTIVLLVALFWFKIPLAGSLADALYRTDLFTVASVGIGLSISAVSANMQQAMLYTFMLIMPLILLSGLATPVRNMPEFLQIATLVNPLRFAIDLVQRVYLEGVGLLTVIHDLIPLCHHRRHHTTAGRLAVPEPAFITGKEKGRAGRASIGGVGGRQRRRAYSNSLSAHKRSASTGHPGR